MQKLIEIYRHHKSIKDPVLGKIPTLEGRLDSINAGNETYQNYRDHEVRGYHSDAVRTEMALDSYLIGAARGSKEHSKVFDSVDGPKEIDALRKKLGDSEANHLKLDRYDKGAEEGESEESIDYYARLYARGKEIADKVAEEIRDAVRDGSKKEIVVAYTHEPIISISLIELAKKFLGYEGNDNAEYFKKLSGSDAYYCREGTGYKIEVEEVDGETKVYLVTKAGRFELDISEEELEEIESDLEDRVNEENAEESEAESEDSEEGSESAE